MQDYVKDDLSSDKPSPFHDALLAHCKELVEMSRRKMSTYYDKWDRFEAINRAFKTEDKQDKQAKERKEPTKMVVPIAHAQVQTFVAFAYAMLSQREYFYELLGLSPEDSKAARFGEAALQRDLDHNKFYPQLYQFLLDATKYGLGIFKCSWVEETQMVSQETPAKKLSFMGLSMQVKSKQSQMVERIKYQGNKTVNVSPYRFFPDPRVSIAKFQDGEFVASEDEYTFVDLKQMQKDGVVSGVDKIPKMSRQANPDRKQNSRLFNVEWGDSDAKNYSQGQSKGTYIITEVEVKLIPNEFEIDGKGGKQKLGPEDYPVKYLIWYANDQRVIRCEPLSYIHDKFTYEVGEFSPDMNRFINDGLLELIDQLQDVISWLINSHITSVRKVIQNFLIVDPDSVEFDDIKNRRPIIRLKPGAARTGIDRWIKQLDVRDVTQGHINDADMMQKLVQLTTGINENLLGQFHGGRRSATEARNVSSSAAARLKMIVQNIYFSALEPLGRQMLSNLRDGLTEATFVRMFGSDADPMSYLSLKRVSKNDLVGDYDFQTFDGSLPSEKGYIADTLTEILTASLANPNAIPLLGMDPKLLMFEILRLKGVRHPQRFALANPALAAQMLQVIYAGQNATAVGQSGQDGSAQPNNGMVPQPSNRLSLNGNGQPSEGQY